ncbi:MAG: hypothetical protein ABI315_06520 [Bacteroidia bacterium]
MLKKEIKVVLITLLLCSSCNDNNENNGVIKIGDYQLNSNKYVDDNFNKYSKIYTLLNDSIGIYVDSLLKEFSTEYTTEWEVDSMLVINSANDKLVATINISIDTCNHCIMDQVSKLLGKKINGIWYFFMGGGHLAIRRNYFGKDEYHPLTFHELSQIGRKNFLESALIKNAAGEYIVNDKWIDAHFYNNGFASIGWDIIKDKVKYDNVHRYDILHKWKVKIDTNEYKPFHRKIETKPAA